MVCLDRPYHFKFFKGCFPQILLCLFLNIFEPDVSFSEFQKAAIFSAHANSNANKTSVYNSNHFNLNKVIYMTLGVFYDCQKHFEINFKPMTSEATFFPKTNKQRTDGINSPKILFNLQKLQYFDVVLHGSNCINLELLFYVFYWTCSWTFNRIYWKIATNTTKISLYSWKCKAAYIHYSPWKSSFLEKNLLSDTKNVLKYIWKCVCTFEFQAVAVTTFINKQICMWINWRSCTS